jgi:hypothetical protein
MVIKELVKRVQVSYRLHLVALICGSFTDV